MRTSRSSKDLKNSKGQVTIFTTKTVGGRLLFLASIVVALVLAANTFAAGKRIEEQESKSRQSPMPAPASTSTVKPTVTAKPRTPTKPVVKASPSPVDSGSQIISCNINTNCGGGTKEMTRNSCDDLICCQVSLSDWKLLGRQECNRQAEQFKSNYWSDSCAKTADAIYNAHMRYCANVTDPYAKTSCEVDASGKRADSIIDCEADKPK